GDTPDVLDVHYFYPGFVHIYTIRRGHYFFGDPAVNKAQHGMEFHGSKASLLLDRGGWVVAAGGERLVDQKHGSSDQHGAHVKNFLHCIRHRDEKTNSDIEDMHRATVTAHLANISYKVRRRVYWDAESERCYRGYDADSKKFLNEDSEANAY